MKTLNNKGILDIFAGATAVQVGFTAFMLTMTALNLGSPTIKHDFRVKRAIEICEFNNGTDCKKDVSEMNEETLLSYIRDDNKNYGFYHQSEDKKSGGKLRERILALNK